MSEASAQIAKLTAKADDLLKRGDAAGGHRTAEGRRLLRECRRYRRQVRDLKAKP
jgi:hypothetical protein